jgi:hypothetical protein
MFRGVASGIILYLSSGPVAGPESVGWFLKAK